MWYASSVTVRTRPVYTPTLRVPPRIIHTDKASLRVATPGIQETTFVESLGKCAARDPLWRDSPKFDHTPEFERSTDKTPILVTYPHTTHRGVSTVEFVQDVMRNAWGPHPPKIDLYVRAGSAASYELQWFWTSVELYWPTFLGRVILVLDKGDDVNLAWLVPARTNHSVLVAYEPVPNMNGRIFNQVSYLNLDRYSSAEYVVTMDSDCAFIRPVTPDALFDSAGKLILVKNKLFQATDWNRDQEFFTGVSDTEYGHSMTTQPIAFKVSSFNSYRDFIQNTYGYCHEQRVVEFIRSGLATPPPNGWFCWMCQLSVFLEHVQRDPDYTYVVLSDPNTRFMRYGMHVNYEFVDGGKSGEFHAKYEHSVNTMLVQSLCLWFPQEFGDDVCGGTTDTTYVKQLSVTYADQTLMPHASPEMVEEMVEEIKSRLFTTP